MENLNVSKLEKSLGLKRHVIGVQFVYFKSEYEALDIPDYNKKTSFCMMVKAAMDGDVFKASANNFGCKCAIEALGIEEEMECVESGQRYFSIGLYESRAVAKAVTKMICRIKQHAFGVVLGPLENMEKADVVIFMTNAYQLMRVVQGYSYKFGTPQNITMAGNQGVCADLCAAPFEKNDMNFSVLCAGTRKMCKWGVEEMGVGVPIQMFAPLVDGVINTLNYIEYPEHKKEIRIRLDSPDELGIVIDDNLHYGKMGKEYVRPSEYDKLKYGIKTE